MTLETSAEKSFSPALTLWVLAPVPVVAVVVRYFGRQIHVLYEKIQAMLAILSARVQENLTGVRVLRAYSQEPAEIAAFDEPWKSVCATFYHELCEARTDPDAEDAIRAGDSATADRYLGWYSPRGGEIGDIPMEEAGSDLGAVMKEVPLAKGGGTAPIGWIGSWGSSSRSASRSLGSGRPVL